MIYQKKNDDRGITENPQVDTLNDLIPSINRKISLLTKLYQKLKQKFNFIFAEFKINLKPRAEEIRRLFSKKFLVFAPKQIGVALEYPEQFQEIKKDILEQCVLYMTFWSADPIVRGFDSTLDEINESEKEFEERIQEPINELNSLLLNNTEQVYLLIRYLECKVDNESLVNKAEKTNQEFEQLAEEAYQIYLSRQQKIVEYFNRGNQ